ncbi:MAG: nucleotidyltransferase domain-containing protein [Christensenellales bacterium]|jgi:predicted nucleotidyltransferase
MYVHHGKAIANLTAYFQPMDWVVTLVLGGSVAKGTARPDSDIDAMVVVTDEKYAEMVSAHQTYEMIEGHCDYPGGYFDVKYYNRDFIRAVEKKGSEPARNAFLGCRVLFSRDEEMTRVVERIPVFQTALREEKLQSFYAAYALSLYYFLPVSGDDLFLRTKAAAEIVHFGLRMMLEDREVLFPCAKAMRMTLLDHFPDCRPLLEAADVFLASRDQADAEVFDRQLRAALSWQPPGDYNRVLARFTLDHEQWWYEPRPYIAEW